MHSPQSCRPRTMRVDEGFTIVELMVSFSALLIVLLGFSRMLLSAHIASNTTHEATLAKEAARMKIEVLQATPLSTIYASYKDSPGFAVRGLEAPLDDEDGLPGRILFP